MLDPVACMAVWEKYFQGTREDNLFTQLKYQTESYKDLVLTFPTNSLSPPWSYRISETNRMLLWAQFLLMIHDCVGLLLPLHVIRQRVGSQDESSGGTLTPPRPNMPTSTVELVWRRAMICIRHRSGTDHFLL